MCHCESLIFTFLLRTAGVHRFECNGTSAEDATSVSSFDDAHEVRHLIKCTLPIEALDQQCYCLLIQISFLDIPILTTKTIEAYECWVKPAGLAWKSHEATALNQSRPF